MTDENLKLVPLRLVPVEVFGTDDCCEHPYDPCESDGYGLSDAVASWSDCNRAIGKIYRVGENENGPYREENDTVTIYVEEKDLSFFEKRFGK